ncbi:MAG: DUF2490 domain-containing protein [Paludibacteraceae bacterium]|nr:DUF2490 domain-containing protein [Paludibacteraceae bacterium]
MMPQSQKLIVRGLLCLSLMLLTPIASYAWEYASQEKNVWHSVQLRAGAEFTKKWNNGIHLGISEDLRFDMFSTTPVNNAFTDFGMAFNKSYTTLTFSYSPLKYLKLDAGYTLKLMGTKDWSDPDEFLRHRVFVGVTGSVKVNRVKLYLRERAMCEMRTDSVNPLEKNKYNFMLRSKLGVEYSSFSKPVKPYAWVEVVNTLNVPEYQQKNGHQYIRRVRTALGVKYKINKNNGLDFYYRFNYGYDRDINITKKAGNIELTEELGYQHAIGITYNFGW